MQGFNHGFNLHQDLISMKIQSIKDQSLKKRRSLSRAI